MYKYLGNVKIKSKVRLFADNDSKMKSFPEDHYSPTQWQIIKKILVV